MLTNVDTKFAICNVSTPPLERGSDAWSLSLSLSVAMYKIRRVKSLPPRGWFLEAPLLDVNNEYDD
jgi:hypothetical protein